MSTLRMLALVAVAAAALSGSPARADALDDLRAKGEIAERWDGFVETRPGASSAAASLVQQVNDRRRAVYAQRAAEQNVPAAEVGKIYAPQIIRGAPGGTFFRKADGSYVKN